ncbi:MAG: hypothetical protein KGL39_50795 [Patescibacteria group bacterium]|nr:hypothetical protein [Patescibacteria group bacterium]
MANDTVDLGLINRALYYLGEAKITDPNSPETTAGQVMVDIFDDVRKESLRRIPWNFAECWAQINYLGAAPVGFDYPDVYALPADYIRVIDLPGYVNSSLSTTGQSYSIDYSSNDYSIQDYRLINFQGQRCISMDQNAAATIPMAYTCDVTNLTLWDPLAKKCFAIALALDVAKGITGMDSLVMQLDKTLSDDLKDAAGVNGTEQRKRLHNYSRVNRDRQLADVGSTGYFTPVAGYIPST